MSEKYLIVGATGSIGSSLAAQLYESGKEVHLVGRDENQTKSLSEKPLVFSTITIESAPLGISEPVMH